MSEVLIGCPVVGNAKTLLKGKRKRKINPSRVGGTKGDETNRRSEG